MNESMPNRRTDCQKRAGPRRGAVRGCSVSPLFADTQAKRDLARISHHTEQAANSVPLLAFKQCWPTSTPQHCFSEAVAHGWPFVPCAEKCEPGKAAGRRFHLVAMLAAIVFTGCGQVGPNAESKTEQAAKAARSEVERGPVRLSVVVEPSPARLSDEPKLTIEIEYPEGVTTGKPEFAAAAGEFIVRDFREPLPRVRGDRRIVQQIYTLEPLRAGEIVIDPIAVTFTDDRTDDEKGKQHSVKTEPITLQVAAAVPQEALSLDQLRPAADPLPLPRPPMALRWWIAAAASMVAVAAGLIWWRRRKRRREQAAPALTPAQLADLELRRLLENVQAKEDVKLFYLELTAIVRRYIERTTGVRAPEQTTQEFLREISRRNDFPTDESQRLTSFLEAADLVKFAAHHPREEDVEESLRRARVFIHSSGKEATP